MNDSVLELWKGRGMPIAEGPVNEYFAINLRTAREARGLSQADLAQRMKELGHACTQATIWKLEQGHREPRLAEAVDLGEALGLWRWSELITRPATFNAVQTVDQWRKRVNEASERTRAAAAAQIEALVNLAFVVRQAVDAGLPVKAAEVRSGGWLGLTPEATVLREVLAARVDWESVDDEAYRKMDEADRLSKQILQALENSGVSLTIQPEDIKPDGPDGPEGEMSRTTQDEGRDRPEAPIREAGNL